MKQMKGFIESEEFTFTVRREDVLTDCLKRMDKVNFSPVKKINVSFIHVKLYIQVYWHAVIIN